MKVPENPTDNNAKSESETQTFKETVLSMKYICLIIHMSIFFATIIFNNINYKSIGLQMYQDEKLSSFSIISSICSCLGRLLGGYIIDKLGFKSAIR